MKLNFRVLQKQHAELKIWKIFLRKFLEIFQKTCNLKVAQLSHSMFCNHIAGSASTQGQQIPLATAKLSIFLLNIPGIVV